MLDSISCWKEDDVEVEVEERIEAQVSSAEDSKARMSVLEVVGAVGVE